MSTTANIPRPGDTLLNSTPNGDVHCPGCCRTAGTAAALVHEDGCPIVRQIERAQFVFTLLGDMEVPSMKGQRIQ